MQFLPMTDSSDYSYSAREVKRKLPVGNVIPFPDTAICPDLNILVNYAIPDDTPRFDYSTRKYYRVEYFCTLHNLYTGRQDGVFHLAFDPAALRDE